ncbi:F0F1 ATP synthase subunit B [Candidatus Uhrbacteria bacterium]|nr:F0F1 ATP synthase subunit B [Candidatus Uhrbacteria bacterium]
MVEETKQIAETAGVLGTLGIDGRLLLAQLVNVGVVVLIVWRWVWKPLVRMLDDRTRRIEQGLRDAAAAGESRGQAEIEREGIVLAARQEARRIIEEAEKAMSSERQAALARTKDEVEKIVLQGKEALSKEREAVTKAAKEELGGILAVAVEKIAGERIDERRDAALIRQALDEAGGQDRSQRV